MADTTKTLQEKVDKLRDKLKTKETEKKSAYNAWFSQKMEFEETFGNKKQMHDPAVKKKAEVELAKLDATYRKIQAETHGLDTKIKSVEAGLKKYIAEKSKLRTDEKGGQIDKEEYAKRKTLLKEMVKKTGTIKRAELDKLKERLKKKEGELDLLSARVEVDEKFYADAKKFVDGDFKGDEKIIVAKCFEFFGKKKLLLKDAQTALKKLESQLKEVKKEERILEDEVKLVTEKVKEGDARLKALETDLARSVESLNKGGLTQEQFNVVKANFEKTLAIK